MNENNKAITTPPTFVNGVTPLNAENLNKLSTAINENKSQLEDKMNKADSYNKIEVDKKISDVILDGTYDIKSNRNKFIANPQQQLKIKTYAGGKDQPTHPKVLYFKDSFAGHKFWMAYTPFPNSINTHENPCITYSDDGYNWSETGINNPIEPTPIVKGYNSDTHLVLVNGMLECWWRTHYQAGENIDNEVIYRKKSSDGINWSEKEEMFRVRDTNAGSLLSPTIIYDENKYKIWIAFKQQCLKYYESIDGTNWQYIRDISIDNPNFENYKIWHFDIIKTTKGFEFVGCYHPTNNYKDNKYIYYAKSSDNITYSERKLLLTTGYKDSFDELELYRPTIVKLENSYMIYYGCRRAGDIWSIGVVEAPTIAHIINLSKSYIEDIEPPIINVNGVSLNKTNLTLGKNQSEKLIATIAPSNATNKNIRWESLNGNIASVDSQGEVLGVNSGETTIRATSYEGNKQATCIVNVENIDIPLQSITLNSSELNMKVNSSNQLTVNYNPSNTTDDRNVTWSASNSNCTVLNGLVTAKTEGQCTITARVGSKEATCTVIITTGTGDYRDYLIAGYDFTTVNSNATTVDDLSGNGLVATKSGTGGTFEGCYKLNANKGWLSMDKPQISTNTCTLEFVATKTRNLDHFDSRICGINGINGAGFYIWIANTTCAIFKGGVKLFEGAITGEGIQNNIKAHVACTFNINEIKVYINGQLVKTHTGNFADEIDLSNVDWLIANTTKTSQMYIDLYHANMYSKALTESEIQESYSKLM